MIPHVVSHGACGRVVRSIGSATGEVVMRLRQSRIIRTLQALILAVCCHAAVATSLSSEPRVAARPHDSVTQGPYALVYKRSKTVHAVYSYEVHISGLT